jgi:TolB-like protein
MVAMARLLGLDVMVEGTVQRIGDRLRIAVRLTDVHSGKLIWAESFDRSAADLASAQTDVANAAALQIGARLAGK